jgi:hypothetical protein
LPVSCFAAEGELEATQPVTVSKTMERITAVTMGMGPPWSWAFLAYRNNLIPRLLNRLCPVQPKRRRRASGHFLWSVTTKVIRNQPELFERRFEIVDDFLGNETSRER